MSEEEKKSRKTPPLRNKWLSIQNSRRNMGSQREIRLTTAFFLLVFVGMIIYLCDFVTVNEQKMMNNSYNSRQEILLSRNYRGGIFSAGGEVLAETVLEEDEKEKRIYPYANLFSHIVGYSTQGKMGIEALANYYLINSSIPLSARVANDVAGVKNPGDNVYTTLNVRLQQEADKQLGMYKGAIIVTEVKTGKVLAMVSNPDFDPNEISDIWQELVEDTDSSVLVNRATQGLYPPGSTFKILTALEYIRENPDSYDRYGYQCNGSYHLGNDKIRCYHGTSHGKLNLERSFARSCNSSFANIGMSLNRTAFANTLENLLFGVELPFDLIYSKSAVHIPAEGEENAEMMQTSIGQGRTQITPLHLNMLTCAIANGGELMRPYLIENVKSVRGAVVKSFQPVSSGTLMSKTEADLLKKFMTSVVEEGTATKLSGLSYTAAGKTGSAEYNNIKGDSHAWFTGFAPAEEPEICVTIILEGAGSGGDYAVPLAKRIFDAYFEEK